MLAGYVVGLLVIPKMISQERYLALSAVLGVIFTFGAFLTTGYVSVGFVAALGFANAMMWPAIFPLAIRGLGRFTELGSALLIMGIAGGAIIPQLFAHLKTHYDFQLVFLVLMLPCYCYIFSYALRGYKAGAECRECGSKHDARQRFFCPAASASIATRLLAKNPGQARRMRRSTIKDEAS